MASFRLSPVALIENSKCDWETERARRKRLEEEGKREE